MSLINHNFSNWYMIWKAICRAVCSTYTFVSNSSIYHNTEVERFYGLSKFTKPKKLTITTYYTCNQAYFTFTVCWANHAYCLTLIDYKSIYQKLVLSKISWLDNIPTLNKNFAQKICQYHEMCQENTLQLIIIKWWTIQRITHIAWNWVVLYWYTIDE